MSRVMRKLLFAYEKTKAQIITGQLISAFVFPTYMKVWMGGSANQ